MNLGESRCISAMDPGEFWCISAIYQVDMGMSYAELADLGTCRKVEHCGPLSMYRTLVERWKGRPLTPSIRAKVQPDGHEEAVAQKARRATIQRETR